MSTYQINYILPNGRATFHFVQASDEVGAERKFKLDYPEARIIRTFRR